MKEEFLDYIDDIIEAMNDAQNFVKDVEYNTFLTFGRKHKVSKCSTLKTDGTRWSERQQPEGEPLPYVDIPKELLKTLERIADQTAKTTEEKKQREHNQ